jgi:hypothetical protein
MVLFWNNDDYRVKELEFLGDMNSLVFHVVKSISLIV